MEGYFADVVSTLASGDKVVMVKRMPSCTILSVECDASCKTCTGHTNADCALCATNYTLNSADGTCVLNNSTVVVPEKKCGDEVVSNEEECDPPGGIRFLIKTSIVGCDSKCKIMAGYYGIVTSIMANGDRTVAVGSKIIIAIITSTRMQCRMQDMYGRD